MYLFLDLQVHDKFGAGVAALQTARELLRRKGIELLLSKEPRAWIRNGKGENALVPIWNLSKEILELARKKPSSVLEIKGSVVLKATFPFVFDEVSCRFRGSRKTLANYVFEQTVCPPGLRRKAATFDAILCASQWCRDVLAGHGVHHCVVLHQAADVDGFKPLGLPKYPNFTVFSGGKFEYRKGQDLVTKAFRAFVKRHDDVQLCLLWNNRWFKAMGEDFSKMNLSSLPGENRYKPWLASLGIDPSRILEIPETENSTLPSWINRCHVGLFPSRAEGGTNICAMETMACGVPVILSKNTGHLDLAGAGRGLFLENQKGIPGLEGWGESDVDEIVGKLEWAYHHRDRLEALGQRARAFMLTRTWRHHVDQLLALC